MRRLLTGCFVTLLLLLNTLVLIGPLMVFALLKLVLPGRFRDYASWAVMWIAETWAEIDKLIFRLCIPTQWDIRGGDDLRRDTSYLVISNHQSWVDIPALIQTLNRRTPFFKFFLKKELIWVPFLGPGVVGAGLPVHEALHQGVPGEVPGAGRQGSGNHQDGLRAVQAPAGDGGQLSGRHALHRG